MLILKYSIYLGNELNSPSNFLDLLLSKLANKLGSDDQWLLWELSLSEDLEVSVVGHINNWGSRGVLGGLCTGIISDEGPDLVQVDDWAEVLVLVQVEVTHTNLSEVTWMVFIEHDSVVMLSSCITATSWMLSMLSNTTVSSGHVSSLLSILSETCNIMSDDYGK